MLIFHGWNIYGYSAGNIYGYSAAPCAKFCYAWIHICVQGTPGACVLICFEIDCSWKHSWIYVANSAAIYDNIAQPKPFMQHILVLRINNCSRKHSWIYVANSAAIYDNIAQPRIQNTFRMNPYVFKFLNILFPKPFMQHTILKCLLYFHMLSEFFKYIVSEAIYATYSCPAY